MSTSWELKNFKTLKLFEYNIYEDLLCPTILVIELRSGCVISGLQRWWSDRLIGNDDDCDGDGDGDVDGDGDGDGDGEHQLKIEKKMTA